MISAGPTWLPVLEMMVRAGFDLSAMENLLTIERDAPRGIQSTSGERTDILIDQDRTMEWIKVYEMLQAPDFEVRFL